METQARTDRSVDHDSICEAIVLAVAEAEDVSPQELRPRLYDIVDPDALEQLFSDSERALTSNLAVTFAYGEWSVQVYSDGQVSVIERPDVSASGSEPAVSYR